jgi:DNA repair protein RecN (Recombination protein N)
VIRTLQVFDLAVIEEIGLELGPGLNVVTGETGAGKSILLGALALLRGGRISSDLVRTGAREARVEAILDDPALLAKAREHGLATEDDSELIISRTVSREGRGRIRVNGSLATAAVLARITGESIEVVGQGEHQQILRPDVQAAMLDRFAGVEAQVDTVSRLYRRWTELGREIAERRSNAEVRLREEDRLRFEIEQIRAVAPQSGEVEALELERARLAHVDRLARDAAAALEALEGEEGVRDRVAGLRVRLSQAAALDRALEEVVQTLERVELELAEALAQCRRYESSLEPDPARLEAVEARLAELRRLRDRYGPTVEEILGYLRTAEQELERIGADPAHLERLEHERQEVGEELGRLARGLSDRRRKAAGELAVEVEAELGALDLRGARFEARLEPVPLGTTEGFEAPAGPRGRERAEFWLAPNPGEEPRRLRDAASGGELARVLLALRTALRESDRGCVLLFDEVDAGIGGRTARRVGERLRGLGRRHQVVCVTHLPQIAALGDIHNRIVKQIRQGRTTTRAERLSGEARVQEIARVAGGGRITAAARAHARELLAG